MKKLSRIWRIGTMVVLKSNYIKSNEDLDILIGGDPKLLSPILIITELTEEKEKFNENDDSKLSATKHFMAKCIWFSHSTYSIQEVLVSTRLLDRVKKQNEAKSLDEYEDGLKLELKSTAFELAKRKSTLRVQKNETSQITTAELNFVGPVFQIIGKLKNEPKIQLSSNKNLKINREVSEQLIKCKYFNPVSDKLSEVLIPKEALIIIHEANEEQIKLVKNAINEHQYLVEASKRKIIKPNSIHFRNGRYYIEGYDMIESVSTQMIINDENKFLAKKSIFKIEFPQFINSPSGWIIKEIGDKYFEKLKVKTFLKIEYTNRKKELTTRVIEFMEAIDVKSLSNRKSREKYIKAFCYLRKAERCFKVDGISKLSEFSYI